MNWSDLSDLKWKDVRKRLDVIDRDDLLNRIGLEEHTPTSDFFTGLGLFAIGVLVGAGLGVMFAPKPGAEMRTQVTDAIRNRGRPGEGGSVGEGTGTIGGGQASTVGGGTFGGIGGGMNQPGGSRIG